MDHNEPIGEECSLEGPFDDFGTAQRFGLRDNQPEIARRNWNRLLGDIPGLESL